MKYLYSTLLLLTTFLAGLLCFSYRQGWIIIAYPQSTLKTVHLTRIAEKKIASFWFWKNGAWQSEKMTLLWSKNSAQNSMVLTKRWLILLEEENLLQTVVMVQTAITSPSESTLYLSFDRSCIPQQESLFIKWRTIEGLLKTLRETGIPVQEVYFLVDHQPLIDDDLDFSRPWPIAGFIS